VTDEPEIVFFKRPNPKEGETTVTPISGDMFRFFQEQVKFFREFTAGGTTVPLVVTRTAAGDSDSETLTLEGLRNWRSISGVINHFSMQLRAGIAAGNYAGGAILSHAVLAPDSAMPTDDLAQADGIVVWLADREQTVQVRMPNEGGGELTGERVLGLPIYSAAYPLVSWPAPRPAMGTITACGFEWDESGTWAMFESGDLVQRDREGQPRLEAPVPRIDGEVERVRVEPDGTIVVTMINRQDVELFRAPLPVHAAAVTQSVQFALTAHAGRTVLWDLYVGRASQALPVDGHHTALAFSSDGRLALCGGTDGSLTLVQLLPD
jgi:hypothetical protein